MSLPQNINIADYRYHLPEDRIAKYPLAERDCSKLLMYKNRQISDHIFYKLPELLDEGSLLIMNNTRVIHARLYFQRASGAKIEIFCLEPISPVSDIQLAMQQTGRCTWKCLVGNAKKWKGEKLFLDINTGHTVCRLEARLAGRLNESFIVEFSWTPGILTFAQIIEAAGNVPLPPYIHRPAEQSDNERYQTVYARYDGSVAAPTAGLHFTSSVLENLKKKNISTTYTTLHVGAGTFKPVQTDDIKNHVMHSEQVVIDKKLVEDILNAHGKIIAAGTTTIRSLESLYYIAANLYTSYILPSGVGQWEPYDKKMDAFERNLLLENLLKYMRENGTEQISFSTNIIIIPGYRFKMTDGMVTNFHQPGSTLLLLVSAFLGEYWETIYDHALNNHYRFLSYGDACLFMKE